MGTWNHSSHRELSKAITSGGKNKQLIESEVYSEEFHDSSINTNEENEATFNNSQQQKNFSSSLNLVEILLKFYIFLF